MNRPNSLASVLLILALLPAAAERLQPQVSVSGSAEVKVAPDEVDLKVGVEIRHERLEDAKRQNDQRVSNALRFLKSNGVKDKNVQTDYIIIEAVYDPHPGIHPQTGLPLPGYETNRSHVE